MRGPFRRASERREKKAREKAAAQQYKRDAAEQAEQAEREAMRNRYAISKAVMDELSDKIKCNKGVSYYLHMSHLVEQGKVSQETVNSDRELIQKYREWLKTQTDADIIRAYDFWLGFHERYINKAQATFDLRKIVNALPKPTL